MDVNLTRSAMDDEDPNILYGGDLPFDGPQCTLGEAFFKSLLSGPFDRVLVVESETGRCVTCSEYFRLTVKIALALREIGLRRGERVVFAGKNGIDIYAAAAAVLYLGCAVTPVDPTIKSYEFQRILKIVEPKIIFCDGEALDMLRNSETDAKVIVLCGDPFTACEYTKLEDFLPESAEADGFRPEPSEDTSESIAFIAFSSGTMGLPKAALLSDKSMVSQLAIWSYLNKRGNFENLTFLQTSHFFWITGITLFITCTCGLKKRVLVRDVTSTNILKAIDSCRPQISVMAPAHVDSVLDDSDFESYDLTSLKILITGGAALQKVTYSRILQKWKNQIHVSQGYGCTEASGIITSMLPGDDIASVGHLVPGCKAKVVKDGAGAPCEHGETGELCFKSPSLMNGYLKDEEATKEAIDDEGWLHTGDIGHLKNGMIYITGRKKELIKYKSLQIAPAELEELIHSVPGVADVGVVGIKVDSYTYHPMALVVKNENSEVTEEDIAKCVNENLSEYKKLRGGVCFVSEIPRNLSGKIKRNMLQSLAEALYMDDL